MARKKRGGRRGFRIGKWVNLAFKAIGATVALSPAIRGVVDGVKAGDPGNIPVLVTYNYSGVDLKNPGAPNVSVLTGAIVTVLVGLGLAKLGGFLGRRF